MQHIFRKILLVQGTGFTLYWEKVVVALVLWSCIWLPFDVASFCLPHDSHGALTMLNMLVDYVFWVDLLLNFITVR